jgi:hypothetical protein
MAMIIWLIGFFITLITMFLHLYFLVEGNKYSQNFFEKYENMFKPDLAYQYCAIVFVNYKVPIISRIAYIMATFGISESKPKPKCNDAEGEQLLKLMKEWMGIDANVLGIWLLGVLWQLLVIGNVTYFVYYLVKNEKCFQKIKTNLKTNEKCMKIKCKTIVGILFVIIVALLFGFACCIFIINQFRYSSNIDKYTDIVSKTPIDKCFEYQTCLIKDESLKSRFLDYDNKKCNEKIACSAKSIEIFKNQYFDKIIRYSFLEWWTSLIILSTILIIVLISCLLLVCQKINKNERQLELDSAIDSNIKEFTIDWHFILVLIFLGMFSHWIVLVYWAFFKTIFTIQNCVFVFIYIFFTSTMFFIFFSFATIAMKKKKEKKIETNEEEMKNFVCKEIV